MNYERSSGVLLHPTSLPGEYGIGSLGRYAYEFIDFLSLAGQKLWQVLPLGPTGFGDSPYQSFSAFAGNPLLISIEKVRNSGWLLPEDLVAFPDKLAHDKVDYGRVINTKIPLLRKSCDRFFSARDEKAKNDYEDFCTSQASWLDDFSLFMAIKTDKGGKPWYEWEEGLKKRDPILLKRFKEDLKAEIRFQNYLQFLFHRQWHALKQYANLKKIKIIGDIPIFVAYDSADAWANPGLFHFDENLKPLKVAGVPPDYFSATGQLWGNPLYNWSVLKESGYEWWIKRFKKTFQMVDYVRLDHFRGFEAYWAVPSGDKTAEKGQWEKGPGQDFFKKIYTELGDLPIIAEDLGVITPEVNKLRESNGFPGMKILQFGFNMDPTNTYLPHNFTPHSVVYTGTHDNDTTKGWFYSQKFSVRRSIVAYLGSKSKIVEGLIRLAMASVAVFAITPLQDLLKSGSESRMNHPGSAWGNWKWRYKKGALKNKTARRLYQWVKIFGR